MVKARRYILVKRFDGFPKIDDLKIVEEELPALKDGEFLAEAVYISVDPYLRAYVENMQIGSTMVGAQVAKIIESKNSKFLVGEYIKAYFGWRTHTIDRGDKGIFTPAPRVLRDYGHLPLSLSLGILGMTGNTAYFGLIEICKPKEGDTVVVSGAAGAVGNVVGQIAKIKGCRVIGITGSDEKGKFLKELGFDEFINYRKPYFAETLSLCAPDGIDCYFDNVGGEISSIVISQMNHFGRIAASGYISAYNAPTESDEYPCAPILQPFIIRKELTMEGFIVFRWLDRYEEGLQQNMKWIKEGKLRYKETVSSGFENLFEAFVSMLKGGNMGKSVVKI